TVNLAILTTAPAVAAEPAYTPGTTNSLSWTTIAGVTSYYLQWSKNSTFASLAGSRALTASAYMVTGLTDGQTYYYRVRCGTAASTQSVWSNVVCSQQDATRPRLSAVNVQDLTTLEVTFSEAVVNADKAVNYSCTGGVTILSVVRLSDTRYRLTTTNQTPGTIYTLTVGSAVKDRAGNPMAVGGNSLAFTKTSAAFWPLYR
ncbi:Ig-like domain-containing protein, partial [Candidatus Sumerlaeota bacterium]|nr:Ig-like domain-containing protein [Candidatus Sumerlaeota bacterium]